MNAQEIAERDAYNKGQLRGTGFDLMKVRDAGEATLSNGSTINWHVNRPDMTKSNKGVYVYPMAVPPGMLYIDGKLYDAEELAKYLRWA